LSFEEKKQKLTSAPILGLPCFPKIVEVKSNASKVGIRVILSQERRPIGFYSEKLNMLKGGSPSMIKNFIP